MSGKAATLQPGVRLADYLSCGLLARICPPDKVALALAACGRQSQRQRDLPAHATAYYVMALALYQGVNYSEVLRIVTEGMQMLGDSSVRRDVGKSGISAARTRLGWQAMAHLADQVLTPLADERTPGAFVSGLAKRYRLVSLDGSCLEVADQSANAQAFGYPSTGQGRTGYPQIRFTALVENGTHALFGIASAGFKDSEVSLAHKTIAHLQPGMLCLADRGLSGFALWQAASATGAQLLWRVNKNRRLPVHKRLPDGSYLSQIEPAAATRKTMARSAQPIQPITPITVRVIQYQLPSSLEPEPLYRLITTLVDHQEISAQTLARLYRGRWTIETTLAEMKTTLKGSAIVLRSKTPDLVRQEFYALVIAHYAIRKLMQEASLGTKARGDEDSVAKGQSQGAPPDALSFKQAVSTVRRKLPNYGAISP
jgi:hypothetical protein